MGRLQYQRDIQDEPANVHPIWRGIGFLLLGVIAIMSYAGANLLVEANKTKGWITVPTDIRGGVSWAPDLYAELIVMFFLMMIGFGVITIVYSIIYKISRPAEISICVKIPVHQGEPAAGGAVDKNLFSVGNDVFQILHM